MPRILFVKRYHFLQFSGGAEEQSWLLAAEFARRGWDVHYVSEMNALPDPPVMDGVVLHGLPENPPYVAGNRDPLRRLMRELAPDVVYNRSYDVYTRDAILEAPPRAVTIWASAMTGDGFIWPRLREMRKLTPLPLFLKRLPIHYTVFSQAKRAVRKASMIFVQRSDQMADFRHHGIETTLVRNVQPSVPESEIQTHQGKPLVLWAASLKDWKRPELFVDLARRCRDLDADFVMIGAVQDKHYESGLATATTELPNLRWDGHIPLTRVGEYFARAHLFVNTSVQLEGYPNSFIHAWLHGIPVATLGVNPEALLSERGFGMACSDMSGLESAVRNLLNHPEQRKEIGTRARDFAVKEHDLKAIVDRIEVMLAERGVTLPKR